MGSHSGDAGRAIARTRSLVLNPPKNSAGQPCRRSLAKIDFLDRFSRCRFHSTVCRLIAHGNCFRMADHPGMMGKGNADLRDLPLRGT